VPSHPCKHPTCSAYVATKGFCAEHSEQAKALQADRHSFYDRHQRDAGAKRFYSSAKWLRARARKLASSPVCERCHVVFADTVHHKIALKHCIETQKTDQANLLSVCGPCHNAIEAEARKQTTCS
jgi:hypothetical protein